MPSDDMTSILCFSSVLCPIHFIIPNKDIITHLETNRWPIHGVEMIVFIVFWISKNILLCHKLALVVLLKEVLTFYKGVPCKTDPTHSLSTNYIFEKGGRFQHLL
jgi:hypothetical protein